MFGSGCSSSCWPSRFWFLFLLHCVAYGVGLSLAFVALSITNSAQPALLYIVPCLLFTLLSAAAIEGQLMHFLRVQKADTREEIVSYTLPAWLKNPYCLKQGCSWFVCIDLPFNQLLLLFLRIEDVTKLLQRSREKGWYQMVSSGRHIRARLLYKSLTQPSFIRHLDSFYREDCRHLGRNCRTLYVQEAYACFHGHITFR